MESALTTCGPSACCGPDSLLQTKLRRRRVRVVRPLRDLLVQRRKLLSLLRHGVCRGEVSAAWTVLQV